MTEPNVRDLPIIKDFRVEREGLEKEVLKLDSLTERSNLFLHISRLYKTVAENTQNEKTKRNATTEAKYFLTQAVRYGRQYTLQEEMLPEMFNVDKPMG